MAASVARQDRAKVREMLRARRSTFAHPTPGTTDSRVRRARARVVDCEWLASRVQGAHRFSCCAVRFESVLAQPTVQLRPCEAEPACSLRFVPRRLVKGLLDGAPFDVRKAPLRRSAAKPGPPRERCAVMIDPPSTRRRPLERIVKLPARCLALVLQQQFCASAVKPADEHPVDRLKACKNASVRRGMAPRRSPVAE